MFLKATSVQSISDNNPIVEISDPFEKVLKFKELLDQGVLTQEEFDTKKKELLGL